MRLLLLFLSATTAASFSGNVNVRAVVTTGSLFEQMIDMDRLSRFPDPPYRNVQYSSYDHRSQIPGGPHWFANDDGFGGEPVPNVEKILKAPMARFWKMEPIFLRMNGFRVMLFRLKLVKCLE